VSTTRLLHATLLLASLAWEFTGWLRAQGPPAEWVPFVAKWVSTTEYQAVWGTYTVVTSGVFVRDKHGSWLRRETVDSNRLLDSDLPDTAWLCDRVHHEEYELDFRHKTFTPVGVSERDRPLSLRDFAFQHSLDKFLGEKVISGVECEGYAIHESRHKSKYVTEDWYAPSLNYLLVERKSHRETGQKVTTLVEDIQVSEPDPRYFLLPQGFKLVK